MDYAIIRTGGKQYRVIPGQQISIERIDGEPGSECAFTDVLMVASSEGVKVGAPRVEHARVTARIVAQEKADKILVFKKKRRKNYRRRQGHRQKLTTVRVTGIEAGAQSHGA